MFWIKYLQSLLRTLNENTSPTEIAAGCVLGSMIGLLPKSNLLALGIWILIMVLQVNISMATAAIVVFAIVGHITDPLAEKLGFYLLSQTDALKSLWTTLYNTPVVPFTNFNNTLVMGNLTLSILLAPFVFLIMRQFVVVYRRRFRERVLNSKLMKGLQATSIFSFYQRWTHR